MSGCRNGWLWLALLVAAGYLAYLVADMRQVVDDVSHGRTPASSDFTTTYIAAHSLREAPAAVLYDTERWFTYRQEGMRDGTVPDADDATAARHGRIYLRYPPHFIPHIQPLARLPYVAAWATWLALTAVPYLLAMRWIGARGIAVPVALVMPAVFFNLVYGQVAFLLVGYLALGLLLLPTRPLLSGLLLAMVSIKPQFGILIPVALAAGGYWRTFASAVVTLVLAVLVSAAWFGVSAWTGFLGLTLEGFGHLSGDWVVAETLSSVTGAAILAGFGTVPAHWFQGGASVLAAAAVFWAWRRTDAWRYPLQASLLCSLAVIASPSVFVYDLLLLAPAAAWLIVDMQRSGSSTWEEVALVLLLGATMFHHQAAEHLGVSLGLIAATGTALLTLMRLRSDRPPATQQRRVPADLPADAGAMDHDEQESVSRC